MADYQIDINTLTEDIELPVNPRYTGLYFKGAQSLADVITSMEGSDTGNNLTINLTDGHKIILTDYFAKNGKYTVKTIKTDSTTENPLTDLIAYVNDNSIKGSAQNIYDTGIIKTLTTTVFDDIVQIDSDANLTINTVNGNDTIYADGGNDTLTGGLGTNSIIYKYYKDPLSDQNTYGDDTIKLTKGETLFINVKYDDDSKVNLHLEQGTGRNINDLIITNDAPDQTDKIIVQNYYAKDTGATVYINGVDVVNITDTHPLLEQYKGYVSLVTGANTFNDDTTITTYKGSALADRMDATDMSARTDKKGNVLEGKGLKIQTGLGNDRIRATVFNDEIITEGGDDNIYATAGNDTITGGTGTNKIFYGTADFNTDTFKLTKGENLSITGLDYTGIAENGKFTVLNNKDLYISSKYGNIIIKDYYARDLGATVRVGGVNLAETAKIYFDETAVSKGMIKTGVLADKIDISAMTDPFKEVKGVKYGANITSGDGNDVITGSDFNDTINAGDGNDTIIGSNGADNIVGGKGTTKVDYTGIAAIGNDTITLTKGETLEIAGLSFGTIDENARYTSPNKKDLVITSDHGTVTVKDYYARDLGATVTVDGVNPAETAKIYFDENALNKTGALTTSVLADNIDVSGLTTPTKEVKGVKYGANITSGAGNDIITGSNFNDTINAGDGNDTIIGSNGSDKITGGAGQNKIVYQNGTQMDGDTITLTKGEQILIDASAIEGAPTYQVNKNNLEIKIGDSTLTLVNFASKDITYNGTNKTEDTSRVELKINGVVTPVDLKTELLTELNVNKNYTGTWLADNISASDYEDAKNRGLTLDGKGGNDSITGSKYADILKGGDGNDTITGGLENDKLYGEAGKNTFVFNTGDGKDTIFAGKGEDTIKLSCTSLSVVQNNKDLIIDYSAND